MEKDVYRRRRGFALAGMCVSSIALLCFAVVLAVHPTALIGLLVILSTAAAGSSAIVLFVGRRAGGRLDDA